MQLLLLLIAPNGGFNIGIYTICSRSDERRASLFISCIRRMTVTTIKYALNHHRASECALLFNSLLICAQFDDDEHFAIY